MSPSDFTRLCQEVAAALTIAEARELVWHAQSVLTDEQLCELADLANENADRR
jgi:hypothetical protein